MKGSLKIWLYAEEARSVIVNVIVKVWFEFSRQKCLIYYFSISVAKLSTANIEERKGSIFDQNIGPPLDQTQLRNYKTIEQILIRMNRLCVDQNTGKERPHEQLLLRNMGVHTVVLDLLQIPYDQKEDILMNEIIKLAHEFLQNFCLKYSENQKLLHKHVDDFMNPGLLEAQTMCAIFKGNSTLCNEVSEKVVQHFVHCIGNV